MSAYEVQAWNNFSITNQSKTTQTQPITDSYGLVCLIRQDLTGHVTVYYFGLFFARSIYYSICISVNIPQRRRKANFNTVNAKIWDLGVKTNMIYI